MRPNEEDYSNIDSQTDAEFIKQTKDDLHEASITWNELEANLKHVESIHGHLVVPATIELRHASRHLFSISLTINSRRRFSSDERSQIRETLHQSLQSIDAAERELVDSVFLLLRAEFDEYAHIYSFEEMSTGFSDFDIYRAKLEELHSDLIRARRQTNQREEIYKTAAKNLVFELTELRQGFIDSIAESGTNRRKFETEMQKLQNDSARWRLLAFASFIATLASLFLSLGINSEQLHSGFQTVVGVFQLGTADN